MIVDLDDKDERGTFELPGGGKVHLRLLNQKDLKEMRTACVSSVVEYPLLGKDGDSKYHRFEAQRFDGDKWDALQWDRVIVGWEDLFSNNNQAIPVTPANKLLLMERVPMFAQAVREGLKAMKEAETAKAEVREKN